MEMSQSALTHSPQKRLQHRGLSQKELAEKIGSPQGAVSNWFRGLKPGELKQTQILQVMNEAGDELGLDRLTGDDLWPK